MEAMYSGHKTSLPKKPPVWGGSGVGGTDQGHPQKKQVKLKEIVSDEKRRRGNKSGKSILQFTLEGVATTPATGVGGQGRPHGGGPRSNRQKIEKDYENSEGKKEREGFLQGGSGGNMMPEEKGDWVLINQGEQSDREKVHG